MEAVVVPAIAPEIAAMITTPVPIRSTGLASKSQDTDNGQSE
jgi:hypothetical protein